MLGKYQLPSELEAGTLQLLRELKKHVLSGVENRHELVPEVLRLIPLFARLGAVEEAERLYETMLDVSMGPTWYKEDQFSLLTSVLAKMPVSDEVVKKLPLISGYLDRADGEMTFQRYVRFQKSRLIGQLFRRNRCASGCKYFIRQTAGLLSSCAKNGRRGRLTSQHLGRECDSREIPWMNRRLFFKLSNIHWTLIGEHVGRYLRSSSLVMSGI